MRSDVASCARNCMNIFNAALIALSLVIDLRSLRQGISQDAGLLSFTCVASTEISREALVGIYRVIGLFIRAALILHDWVNRG